MSWLLPLTVPLVPLEGEAGPTFGTTSFESRPLFPGAGMDWLNNHLVQAVIGAALVIAFWLWVSHKQKVVPSKRQFIGEYLYNIIRNGIGRDVLGPEFRSNLPWLIALFSFIVVNNLFGETFVFMFPTFSKIGYPYALAILSFLLYNFVGIRKWGFRKYFTKSVLPKGVPVFLWWLIIPLEFISNFIVRPITLALRLFANLFAGHLVVLVFIVGGGWLLTQLHNPLYVGAGAVAFVFGYAIFALELFVGVLQAYIFTILTAQYVASSLEDAH